MLIVLDTNQFWSDIWMKKTNFKILEEYIRRHSPQAHLIVPQIVLEEVVNNYRSKLMAAVTQSANAIATLRSFGYDDNEIAPFVPPNVESLTARYEAELQASLRSLSARQPGYDQVDVKAIAKRALARRKPFDKHGQNGFRDCVIWESILPLIKELNQRVVLITSNTSDFGEHNAIADDLKDDLKALKLNHLRVAVCQDLQRFISEEIKPHLDKLNSISHQIQAGTYAPLSAIDIFRRLHPEIQRELKHIVPRVLPNRQVNQYRYSQQQLSRLSDTPDDFMVMNVWRLETDEHVVANIVYTVSAFITCDLEYLGPHTRLEDKHFTGAVTLFVPMEFVLNTIDGDIAWDLSERIDSRYSEEWWQHGASFPHPIPGKWYVCRLPQIRRWDGVSPRTPAYIRHEDRRIDGPFETEHEAKAAQLACEGGGPPSTELWQCPP